MTLIQIILLVLGALAALFIGYLLGKSIQNKRWEGRIKEEREEAIKMSRAVLGGQFSEQLAPYLPDFPYSPTECRFIGKPIDFIVFKGMDEKNISEVKFVEVKSAKSKLSGHEKKLKDTIQAKKVSWEEYRIPEDVTRKKEEEK